MSFSLISFCYALGRVPSSNSWFFTYWFFHAFNTYDLCCCVHVVVFLLIGSFMPSMRMTYAIACMSYATACKCVYVYVPASRCPWARYELLSSPSLNAFASEARQRASVDGPGWIYSNLLASCSQVILPLLPHPPPARVCICMCVHACGRERERECVYVHAGVLCLIFSIVMPPCAWCVV